MNFQVTARGEGAEAVTRMTGLSEQSSTAVINGSIQGEMERTRTKEQKLQT